ncbi:MAG: hypothetical protein RR135_06020 [Oscillospiraceae bacterium]
MDFVVELIKSIILVLLGFLALYFRTHALLSHQANTLITQAEKMYKDATKMGGTKFEWVVGELFNFIPAPLRIVVPRSAVEALVQVTFDAMAIYANTQLGKVISKTMGSDSSEHIG